MSILGDLIRKFPECGGHDLQRALLLKQAFPPEVWAYIDEHLAKEAEMKEKQKAVKTKFETMEKESK